MNPAMNTIANRLSLRQPQRISLEILARICDIISLEKQAVSDQPSAVSEKLAESRKLIAESFPSVMDFERDFPSLCFALVKVMEDDTFFEGRYKDKVITVHSTRRLRGWPRPTPIVGRCGRANEGKPDGWCDEQGLAARC